MNVLVSNMTNRTTGGRHPHHGSDKNASSFCIRPMSSGADEIFVYAGVAKAPPEKQAVKSGGEVAIGTRAKAVENTNSGAKERIYTGQRIHTSVGALSAAAPFFPSTTPTVLSWITTAASRSPSSALADNDGDDESYGGTGACAGAAAAGPLRIRRLDVYGSDLVLGDIAP